VSCRVVSCRVVSCRAIRFWWCRDAPSIRARSLLRSIQLRCVALRCIRSIDRHVATVTGSAWGWMDGWMDGFLHSMDSTASSCNPFKNGATVCLTPKTPLDSPDSFFSHTKQEYTNNNDHLSSIIHLLEQGRTNERTVGWLVAVPSFGVTHPARSTDTDPAIALPDGPTDAMRCDSIRFDSMHCSCNPSKNDTPFCSAHDTVRYIPNTHPNNPTHCFLRVTHATQRNGTQQEYQYCIVLYGTVRYTKNDHRGIHPSIHPRCGAVRYGAVQHSRTAAQFALPFALYPGRRANERLQPYTTQRNAHIFGNEQECQRSAHTHTHTHEDRQRTHAASYAPSSRAKPASGRPLVRQQATQEEGTNESESIINQPINQSTNQSTNHPP